MLKCTLSFATASRTEMSSPRISIRTSFLLLIDLIPLRGRLINLIEDPLQDVPRRSDRFAVAPADLHVGPDYLHFVD